MPLASLFPAALLTLSAPAPAAAASLAEVKRAGRLVAAAPMSDLPVEGDILKSFALALGVELRVEREAGTAGVLQAVQEGRVDVGAGGLVSPRDRRDGIVFSSEVFPTRFVAVNRAPAALPGYIEAVRDASRILAPAATGASEVALAAKLPSLKTDTTLSLDKALATLRTEGGSVALIGLFDALVARRADPALQIGVGLGVRQSVAFAVRSADASLLASLNAHLDQLRSSPSYTLLLSRGLGEESLQILSRTHLTETR
jgi:ABC-type amino acid transport substrate-binding protein